MIEDWKARVGRKLYVRVMPGTSRNNIKAEQPTEDGSVSLRVYTTALPDDGKANEAVIEMLAEELGMAKSCFQIIRGEKSNNKIIEIIK